MQKKRKLKRAVALKYDVQKHDVPKITARGKGVAAENMIKRGEKEGVSIYEDERLVKKLIEYEVGTDIPPELYEIVAQVLVFVESVDENQMKAAKK